MPTLDEMIKRARATRAIDTPAPQQYFYRTDGCNGDDINCTCWHDQGTGPFPDKKPGDYGMVLSWRDKTAPQPASVDREALVEVIDQLVERCLLDGDSISHAARLIADALIARGQRLPGGEETMAACAACEDRPKAPNIPCAVCGKGAVPETLAWAVVGEDGKIDPQAAREMRIEAEALMAYPGDRVVRVAIRVLDDAEGEA